MRRIPSLRAISAFVKSAETLNLTLAANDLHLTQSAISQQIKQLEEQIGSILFHRQRRGLMLTNEGLTLYKAIRPVIGDLQQIFAGASLAGTNQKIRLRIDHSLLVARLSSQLAALIQAAGGLKLDIAGADIGEYVGFDRNTILIGPYGTWGGHPEFRSHTVASGKPVVVRTTRRMGVDDLSNGGDTLFTTEKLQGELDAVRRRSSAEHPWRMSGFDMNCVLLGNQVLALNAAHGSNAFALVDEVIAAPFIASGAVEAILTLPEGRANYYEFQCHNELLDIKGVRTFLDWLRCELSYDAGTSK
jgi:DNA-binding transcriptional LysR family regulator